MHGKPPRFCHFEGLDLRFWKNTSSFFLPYRTLRSGQVLRQYYLTSKLHSQTPCHDNLYKLAINDNIHCSTKKTFHRYLKTHIYISRTMCNVMHIFSKCVQNIILFFIAILLLLQNLLKKRPMNHKFTDIFPLIFVYF